MKYGLIELPVQLRIFFKYGTTEDYILSNFNTACKWMKQVEEKRVGVISYHLERYMVQKGRIKLVKFYIEDILELEQQPKVEQLF